MRNGVRRIEADVGDLGQVRDQLAKSLPKLGPVVEEPTVNGSTLVTLGGELDVADAGRLRRDVASSPGATLPDLAIDLRQVAFMAASVVGALMIGSPPDDRCRRQVPAAQRRAARAGSPASACDLEGVLCVHHSVERQPLPSVTVME
jgi:hypothetical protein